MTPPQHGKQAFQPAPRQVKQSSKRTPCASPSVKNVIKHAPHAPRQVKQSSKRTTCASPSVIWLILLSLLILPNPATARKIKTKHAIQKQLQKPEKDTENQDQDSIISISTDSLIFVEKIHPNIHFYGFDKTVTSNLESFFISNGLDKTVKAIEIEITYSDMKGRQLHKRTVSIDCSIPPGETMRNDIKSWDTQKSFYYHKSAKPKRQATPFTAKITLLSIILHNAL